MTNFFPSNTEGHARQDVNGDQGNFAAKDNFAVAL